jgi:hypothetical protein
MRRSLMPVSFSSRSGAAPASRSRHPKRSMDSLAVTTAVSRYHSRQTCHQFAIIMFPNFHVFLQSINVIGPAPLWSGRCPTSNTRWHSCSDRLQATCDAAGRHGRPWWAKRSIAGPAMQ